MRQTLAICTLFLSLLALPATAATLDVDLSRAAEWGPATAVDDGIAQMQQARWLGDDDEFHRLLQDLWRDHPHHPALIDQALVLYANQDRTDEVLAAVAAGTVAEFLGLGELSDEDLLQIEAAALFNTGRAVSARAAYERLLAVWPDHPEALADLFSIARYDLDGSAPQAAILQRALAHPEAAVRVLSRIATGDPWHRDYHLRDEARALLDARPPRPQLATLLTGADMVDRLRRPGLTTDGFDDLLDEWFAAHPAVCNIFADDMVYAALAWLPPAAIREAFTARADRMTPRQLAICDAAALRIEDLDHAIYDRLMSVTPDGGLPSNRILEVAGDWHPDADEVERWARRHVADHLANNADNAMQILRDRGKPAAADSIQAEFAGESALAHAEWRLDALRWSDPSAAAALIDSIVAITTEPKKGWDLLLSHESAGDHEFLDGYLERHGPHATMTSITGAIIGAQVRDDAARLAELEALVRRLAPEQTDVLRLVARAYLEIEEPERCRAIVNELADHPYRPAGLPLLQIDLAMFERDHAAVQAVLEAQLADPDTPVEHLVLQPSYAAGAGWADLAERSLARVEAETRSGCRRRQLMLAEYRQRQGDLAGSRDLLLAVQEDWPGSEAVRHLLLAAGGVAETYEDPTPNLPLASLGGLAFDYTSTDWIEAARVEPGEFPDHDVVLLRDQATHYLASRNELVTRTRRTTQILHDAAASQYSTVRVGFDSDERTPRVLCARIITPDGEVREVQRHEIMVTAHQSEQSDVSDLRDLVVPFAGLKAGSVIDFCYESGRGSFLDLGHAWLYRFGNFMPVHEEVLEIVVADGVEHHIFDEHQPLAPEQRDLEGSTLYRWSVTDQTPVEFEEAAPMLAYFPQRVGCTTYDSWDRLAKVYSRRFWEQTVVNDDVRELATRLTADLDRDTERVQALYTHLVDTVDNIGVSLGDGRFVPTPSHEVLARGYGDCKDKVATLIALCRAVDIECLPVLVGTRPSPELEDDFPCSSAFDHLIAYLPDIDGGTFSDPTLGTGCMDGLPDEVAGQRGLLIEPDGDGKLVQIPDRDIDTPAMEVTVDLYPEDGGFMRAEVHAVLRQVAGNLVRDMLDHPDTTLTAALVQMVVGNGVNEGLTLARWDHRPVGCDGVEIHAVLRDSSWASPDNNDAQVVWVSRADTEMSMPDYEDRTLPVTFDTAQRVTTLLRAHEGQDWRLSRRHSPIRVSAPGFEARVDVDLHDEDGDRRLEIRREMTFEKREYPAKDLSDLSHAFYGYRAAGIQAVRYQRVSHEERLAELQAYCRDNPDDLAFAFQAAVQILGGDMGGDGEAGRERRELARELIAPALARTDVGGMPYLLAAGIAVKDLHYLEADSLLTIGLEHSPRDLYLLGMALQVALELNDHESEIEHLLAMRALVGAEELSYGLITAYMRDGQDDEADREEARLGLIAAEVDSAQLVSAKLEGYARSGRTEEARALLPAAERLLDPFQYRLYCADLADEAGEWDEAIEWLKPVHDENPLNSNLNNNMAWYLGCAGRDLERAEYLVRMALALAEDSTGEDNTLAVVLMQQGKLDEAQEMFASLMEDDRPENQLINGYFLGLCHWLDGDRDRAVEHWRAVDGLAAHPRYQGMVKDALAAAAAGDDPSWLFLWEPEGEH